MNSRPYPPIRELAAAAARFARRVSVVAAAVVLASCGAKVEERIGRVSPKVGTPYSPIDNPDSGAAPTDASTPSSTDARPACGESRAIAPVEPTLALYMMVDRSQYMQRDDKWSGAIASALFAYVTSSEARQLELGLTYYPVDNGSTSTCSCTMPRCNNCRDARVNCNAADNDPAVEIVPRSQHAALAASIEQHSPAGAAALAPAWSASETYLESWQRANPTKRVVRVVIAGGEPWTDGCGDARLSDALEAAEASPFSTYVISLDDEREQKGLDNLALAGGGNGIIRVDPERDVRENLFSAMQQIVEREKGCHYVLLEGALGGREYPEVQLTFPVDGGTAPGPWNVNRAADRQHCEGPHRWFPNPLVSGHVSLCRNGCNQLQDFAGQVKLFARCQSVATQ